MGLGVQGGYRAVCAAALVDDVEEILVLLRRGPHIADPLVVLPLGAQFVGRNHQLVRRRHVVGFGTVQVGYLFPGIVAPPLPTVKVFSDHSQAVFIVLTATDCQHQEETREQGPRATLPSDGLSCPRHRNERAHAE